MIITTASDIFDSFEILELFQHLSSLRPMVALSYIGYVIKSETAAAVAYWFTVDSPDSSAGKTHRQKQYERPVREVLGGLDSLCFT